MNSPAKKTPIRSFFFGLFLAAFSSLLAQTDSISTDHSYLRVKIENDFFTLNNWTDRYFSNGLRLDYQTPQSWRRLNRLRKLFPLLPEKTTKKIKLSFFGQMLMFTPQDLSRSDVIVGDRPYAGLLSLGMSGISSDFSSGTRLTTDYSIGLIGPAAGQAGVQNWVHHQMIETFGAKKTVVPRGWGNQIRNDVALNVRTEFERILFAPVQNIEAIGGFEVNFGTVTNYVALNANLRVGKFNDFFFNSSGLKMRDKVPDFLKFGSKRPFFPANINRKWQVYFFAKPSFRFALNNSLLQGGIFNRKTSPYLIPADQLNRFYVNVEFGYGIVRNRFGVLYLQQFRSPEFQTAYATTWGTVYFFVGMGR